jgi:cytochrome c oxidase assembly protein subunit 15
LQIIQNKFKAWRQRFAVLTRAIIRAAQRRREFNPRLHRFAVLTALATLALLGVGGVVTSKGVGMAVPDWPTTYGYNMFFFPISKWTGGIFYEHSHRLVASGVGLLTTVLAVWLWIKESRAWVRWLGIGAFVGVVLQGVLGGLRVVLFKDEIGIFHATLAQLFFALVCAIALFTSRWWVQMPSPLTPRPSDGRREQQPEAWRKFQRLFLFTTVLIFLQLILGATMRHQHAGLAIPDFPLAYGKLWPALDADSIAAYNARRIETTAANPITGFQVGLQMAHRLLALMILVGVSATAWRARRMGAPGTAPARTSDDRQRGEAVLGAPLRRLAFFWLGSVALQVVLGAWTIWSNKAADVATAHVLVGALSLVTGALGSIIAFRHSTGPVEATALAASSFGGARSDAFARNPAAVLNQ